MAHKALFFINALPDVFCTPVTYPISFINVLQCVATWTLA